MIYSKITIIIKDKPPYFIGSQLRGALGYALKKVTCINPSFQCEECFAQNDCLYYQFYEKKNSFHNYRFDIELGLDFYEFNFYLFEDITLKLPYIISAFHQMLTQNGLGKDRVKYKDFNLYINDKDSFINSKLNLPKNYIKNLSNRQYLSRYNTTLSNTT